MLEPIEKETKLLFYTYKSNQRKAMLGRDIFAWSHFSKASLFNEGQLLHGWLHCYVLQPPLIMTTEENPYSIFFFTELRWSKLTCLTHINLCQCSVIKKKHSWICFYYYIFKWACFAWIFFNKSLNLCIWIVKNTFNNLFKYKLLIVFW